MDDLGELEPPYSPLSPRIVVFDALLADLESTTSHISKRPVLPSDPLLLGLQAAPLDSDPIPTPHSNGTPQDPAETRPPPPAYTPQQTVSSAMKSGTQSRTGDPERLYSTVCKPKSPKSKEPPPFTSASVLGGGLTELDHLLQELNATQFNITDEILAQFPSSKTDEGEKLKDSAQMVKPTATSATLELDKLMASLSDFRVQSNPPPPVAQPVVTSSRPAAPPPQTSGSLDSMLGLLQSDLSRQGIATTAKGTCAACQKPIVSQVVTALGQTWHQEHFVCSHCQKEIGGSNFFEKDGLPFCESDYFSLFSPRCGLCSQPILDKMVTALDKNWHPEHFCCVKCGRPFGEEGFHERDGRQYCQQDFFSMFASRCHGCSKPIQENYISALNVLWHPECFVCRECYTPFVNGSFFEHEGQPLCETHYHRSRGSLCSSCERPITGRCITAMGAKFHPEHFVCAFCLKQLNKGTFKEQGEKPYCHPCFIKLFG
ncbi:transforming growth factor beta-1-induced transcript 1 protein-like isoform X2 [Acipenser ruthenus]|uniref:transforming growth factor beta-1-induced transcript 1 protein-like isoform X2 n=1 Tax=Acipenser ruthenus TaxID=7906 RepID=UPI002740CEC7|nr:transforming growth factor beta-1-induced transcript 1 protein-like isoform X2 [Acipenser ruthenus]